MAGIVEFGTSSEECSKVQKNLNKIAGATLVTEDGAFNEKTRKLLKEFERDSGLTANGEITSGIMKNLEKAAKEDAVAYELVGKGKTYLLSRKDHKKVVSDSSKELKKGVIAMQVAMKEVRGHWDFQNRMSKGSVFAWCIEAYSGIDTPKESLIKTAEKRVDNFAKVVKAKDLKNFSNAYFLARKDLIVARNDMNRYMEGIQKGGAVMKGDLALFSAGCIFIVTLIATPAVAARFALGKIAAGVSVSAGTAAITAIATEVSKGVVGVSQGPTDAAKNIVFDTFIGASIGLLLKGSYGKAVYKAIIPQLIKKLPAVFVKRMSTNGLTRFLTSYFSNNGADILQSIMEDTLKSLKSTSKPVTIKSYLEMVVKNIITAGIFNKFTKSAELNAKSVVAAMSSKSKDALKKVFSKPPSTKEMEGIVAELLASTPKNVTSSVYDQVYGNLKGNESEKKIRKDLVEKLFDKKMIARAKTLAAKKGL